MRFRCCLLLLSLSLLATGCRVSDGERRSDRPEFNTGLPVEPGYAQRLNYSTRWAQQMSLSRGQRLHSIELLGDLLVVVERPDNLITAYRVDDGDLAWKQSVGSDLEDLYAAIGDEQHIYVNSNTRFFTLDRRSGEVLKTAVLDRYVEAGPVLVDRKAVFGSIRGVVYAHDTDVDYPTWGYALPQTIATPPIVDGLGVFATDAAGNYAKLESSTGTLLWRGNTFGPITAAPVVDRNFIIVASEDQSLYSLVSSTGALRWPPYRSEVPLDVSPTVVDRVIYLVEPGIGLTAIGADDGEARWTTKQVRVPVAMRGDLLLAYGNEKIEMIDPDSGDAERGIPTRELRTVLQGPDASLIVVTPEGDMQRLDDNR